MIEISAGTFYWLSFMTGVACILVIQAVARYYS